MDPETLQQLHESARWAYESGRTGIARQLVRKCLKVDRDDGRAWELSGLIHYAEGDYRQSVSALECAQALVPLRPAGRVCLGHAYARVGRTELARDFLRDLIEDAAVSIPLLLQVAIGLDLVGRPDLAMDACRQVLDQDDRIAQAHYDLGFYASRCRYPDAVVESLARKAIELDPDTVQYRVGLAGLLWKHDRLDEAFVLVEKLSNAALEEINCTCCLRRMSDLYKRAADYRRVILCQQRLLQLEASGAQSDCQ